MMYYSYSIAWKVSKYGVFSGTYFPVFGLNTEISIFGHFSRSVGSKRKSFCFLRLKRFSVSGKNITGIMSGNMPVFISNISIVSVWIFFMESREYFRNLFWSVGSSYISKRDILCSFYETLPCSCKHKKRGFGWVPNFPYIFAIFYSVFSITGEWF